MRKFIDKPALHEGGDFAAACAATANASWYSYILQIMIRPGAATNALGKRRPNGHEDDEDDGVNDN